MKALYKIQKSKLEKILKRTVVGDFRFNRLLLSNRSVYIEKLAFLAIWEVI